MVCHELIDGTRVNGVVGHDGRKSTVVKYLHHLFVIGGTVFGVKKYKRCVFELGDVFKVFIVDGVVRGRA